jgi:thiamine monophosphate synthase
MFIIKSKYYLIIENIKDIDLKNIKKKNKFSIIYRNNTDLIRKFELLKFRKECKAKSIKFYIANNIPLALYLNSDGLYLSASNKSLKVLSFQRNLEIIGSAHNIGEIHLKRKQGCSSILFSKLFLVNYDKKAPFLGVIKFNNFLKLSKRLIPLGGINTKNLNSLKLVKSSGLALMSEIKKKPANIINRLF